MDYIAPLPALGGDYDTAYGGQQSQNNFSGLLDEISIFNRALSSNEIAAIYAAGSAGMCKPSPVCAPQPSGLVGWWPGEGNADDELNMNTGTLNGGVAFAPGRVGQAFQFDGVNDSVDLGSNPTLNIPGSLTMAVWAK